MFLPQEIIRAKRDGRSLCAKDIAAFVSGMKNDRITEGQIAAFAMAVYLNGMNHDECVALTTAMRDSGRVLAWRTLDLPGPVVDKHSTGGVGDLVSLILGPMLAASGAFVPMIAGRGLGHTGGTIDKLESIPGYQTSPGLARFQQVVRKVGVAIIGQTSEMAPADGCLYAIRDVTATVESVPLITASILSKKLAAGLDALVMDIKVGTGAVMPLFKQARTLAEHIVAVGNEAGLPVSALLTDMNEPLAHCGGNAIEVRCAIDYLIGHSRSARLHDVTIALGIEILQLSKLAVDVNQARCALEQALSSGAAAEIFARMVAALGGPVDFLERAERYLEKAPIVISVPARRAGYVAQIDTRALGMTIVSLGGGRCRSDAPIDNAVGLSEIVSLGTFVNANQPLAMVHARNLAQAQHAAHNVEAAIVLDDVAPLSNPLIYARIPEPVIARKAESLESSL